MGQMLMSSVFPEIQYPELFFGLVAPVGTDLTGCKAAFREKLEGFGYVVVDIKITDIFKRMSRFVEPPEPLADRPEHKRYSTLIRYGNHLRMKFEDDAFLASLAVTRILRARTKAKIKSQDRYSRVAYILDQFKRKEEIDLLRSIYGRQFFQVSVYSRRGARVDFLAQRFANTSNSANINEFRSDAEKIVQVDENEADNLHGQKVMKIFHDGDFILNIDAQDPSIQGQVYRFLDLLFGSNRISPSRQEYGMFIAKAAALRTLDLSRQVGAAIFSKEGEIITMGSNEVPKGGGGTYWSDDKFDDREYIRKHDSNDRRKREILSEIFDLIGHDANISEPRISDSQFMDALEYGRIIHAEMSAITDAARLGRSVKDGILFCTTFPCHMCAKHIVGAGIRKVVFLEPYPKSLVMDLHADSVSVEGNDRGKYTNYPAVDFEHFFGVSPRRYRELFERGKRKINGNFVEWASSSPRPNLNIRQPYYREAEQNILNFTIPSYIEKHAFDIKKI